MENGRRRRAPAARSPAAALACAAALAALAVSCRPPEPQTEEATSDFSATVSLSASEIRVGDPLRVEVAVTHPDGGTLDLPAPAQSFEVRRRETRTENAGTGRRRHIVVYELMTFELGEHDIFAEPAAWIAPGGERRAAALENDRVVVRSLLEGVAGPRDLKPPLPWPPPLPRWLWALPIVIAFALLAAGIVRWASRRREQRPAAPPAPPDRIALEALERLRTRGWIAAETVEPFFVELSRIVRVYIEGRFGLRAPEQTTEEFLRAAARAAELTAEHRALAAKFLEQCDLVKFARARPGTAEMERALAAAERFVRETTPSAPPPTGSGERAT